MEEIERRPIVGAYRLSGVKHKIREFRQKFATNAPSDSEDYNVLTSTLKEHFRELANPVVCEGMEEGLLDSVEIDWRRSVR